MTDGTTSASKGVLKGSAWNIASLLGPQVWTVVVSIVAARVLGPDRMGRQSFIAFVELTVMALATGAVPVAVMRWIGEFHGRSRLDAVPAMLRWAWRLELATAAVGAAVILTVGFAQGRLVPAWALAALAAALGVLHAIPASVLQGLSKWRQASMVSMTTGGVGALATVLVLLAGGGIVGMFAVEVVISAINLVWTGRLARRCLDGAGDDGGAGFREARPSFRRYLWGSNVDVLVGLVVFRRSEFFFLDRYGSDAEIAFYSVAFATVYALLRVFDGFAGVLAPAFASMFGAEAKDRMRTGFGRALRLLTMLALPGTAGAAVLGPRLLDLAYGNEYQPAHDIFLILVATLPVLALVGLSDALLVGFGQIRVAVIAGIAAAAVNLTLDVALIPRFGGEGAALANAAGQLTAGVPVLVVAWRRVGGVDWRPASFLVVLLTAAATAGAASLGSGLAPGAPGVLAGLLGGGVAAGSGLLVAISLQPADAAWVPEVLPDRFGAVARRLLRVGPDVRRP